MSIRFRTFTIALLLIGLAFEMKANLHLDIHLEKEAYVYGEPIVFKLTIENNTKDVITLLEVDNIFHFQLIKDNKVLLDSSYQRFGKVDTRNSSHLRLEPGNNKEVWYFLNNYYHSFSTGHYEVKINGIIYYLKNNENLSDNIKPTRLRTIYNGKFSIVHDDGNGINQVINESLKVIQNFPDSINIHANRSLLFYESNRLSQIESETLIPVYKELLQRSNIGVNYNAIIGLSHFNDKEEVVGILKQAYNHAKSQLDILRNHSKNDSSKNRVVDPMELVYHYRMFNINRESGLTFD